MKISEIFEKVAVGIGVVGFFAYKGIDTALKESKKESKEISSMKTCISM